MTFNRWLVMLGMMMALGACFCRSAAAEGTIPAPGNSVPTERVIKLRIMTYNIRFGKGMDDLWDLDRTADVIRNANPDLVGIQEVDREWSSRSQFKDVVTELALRLGMYYTFAPALDKNPGAPGEKFGNAILSRFPIRETWSQTLFADGMGRSVVGVKLDIEGVPLNFCTAHLGLSTSDRQRQVAEIVQAMEALSGPVVITGDWNTTEEADEVTAMTRIFQDAQSVVGKAGIGTFPAKQGPRERIDFIFASPEFRVEAVDVPETLASDHLPVIADLSLSIIDAIPVNP